MTEKEPLVPTLGQQSFLPSLGKRQVELKGLGQYPHAQQRCSFGSISSLSTDAIAVPFEFLAWKNLSLVSVLAAFQGCTSGKQDMLKL